MPLDIRSKFIDPEMTTDMELSAVETAINTKLINSGVFYALSLCYQEVVYTGDVVTAINYYDNASFITANRVARNDITYTSDKVTSEVIKVYDTDGTTIIKTYTINHTYSGDNYQSSSRTVS